MFAGVSLAALDFGAAQFGIGRDLSEFAGDGVFGWTVLYLVFGLPVASAALLLRRRWLAVVPLLESATLFSVWFLYYATDWWADPGQGALLPIAGLVLLGWVLLVVAGADVLDARPEPST